jgi:hypothetical protein
MVVQERSLLSLLGVSSLFALFGSFGFGFGSFGFGSFGSGFGSPGTLGFEISFELSLCDLSVPAVVSSLEFLLGLFSSFSCIFACRPSIFHEELNDSGLIDFRGVAKHLLPLLIEGGGGSDLSVFLDLDGGNKADEGSAEDSLEHCDLVCFVFNYKCSDPIALL